MNTAQTIFTIFYGVYFAAVVGLTGPLAPFDTPGMSKWKGKAWLRFIVAFLLINVVPLGYFMLVYSWLEALSSPTITFGKLFILLLLSLSGFAFYRIYWGLMVWKKNNKYIFYQGGHLPNALTDKIDDHPSSEAAGEVLPNLVPGVAWLLCTILIGWIWTHWTLVQIWVQR